MVNPPRPQIPSKIYGVFTCVICGNQFEKPMHTDSYVTFHKKHGTATIHCIVRTNKPICYECMNKYSIEEQIKLTK
jgi:hypothetical protein